MCDFFMSALKKWFFNANALVLPCHLNGDYSKTAELAKMENVVVVKLIMDSV